MPPPPASPACPAAARCPKPAVGFWVFGCRLNQAEAARWQEALSAEGYPIVPREEAQLLCVHSCAVTEHAQHEVLKSLRAFRKRHPTAKILLSGCAATLLPPDCAEARLPHAQKADWLATARALLATLPPPPAATLPPPPRGKTRAALIIQDGCNQHCAYCIVPQLRGEPRSQPLNDLLAHAADLLARGHQEIVLTGCHLALYRDPATGAGLLTLLERLCALPGGGRFRLSSLEPGLLDEPALFRLVAQSRGRLCPFFHLPIQTAADPLLARMGRRYTLRDLRVMLDALCETLPYCGLGADWIVGLPGESDQDAAQTRHLLAAYPFTGAHIFPYSRRPGTPAASMPGQIPPPTLRERLEALTALAQATRLKATQRFLGRELTVLPEVCRNGHWEGWSAERLRCRLSAPATRGRFAAFTPTALSADVLCEAPPA